MTLGTSARYRDVGALAAALAVIFGLAFAPSHAAQNTEAPQAMTSTEPASDTLSAKQQAIPLIAAFMATSDMSKLNTASARAPCCGWQSGPQT